jgi:tetratricopeptide (TPR) repeat protein
MEGSMISAVRGWKTFFLFCIPAVMFAAAGAGAQDSGKAWRDCQTEDADRRISGCTIVINMKGFGSKSKLADALDGRCWAYHLKGMFAQAVADCKAAISIRPTYSFAYNNLGAAYIGLGEHDAAIQVLSKAIELKSNFVWSWANRAKANEAAGHIAAAISDYQRAASLDAGNQSFQQAIVSLTNRSEKPVITPDPQANEKIAELQRELASMRDGMRRQDEERRRQDEERKRIERDEQVRKEEHEKARLKEEDLKKQIERLKKLAESQPISNGPEPGYSMPSGKRVAFVVGINRYSMLDSGRQLGTALNDAELIAQTLKQLGFAVIEGRDVTRSEFNQKWQEFLNEVEPGGVAAFYFAGHGVQVGGMNYLLASDTPKSPRKIMYLIGHSRSCRPQGSVHCGMCSLRAIWFVSSCSAPKGQSQPQ